MGDDIGMDMLGKVEANGATAGARPLRVVIGDGRDSSEIREAHRHRGGISLNVWRAGKLGGLR